MPCFGSVFNSSNRTHRPKEKSYYCFPLVVTNNGEEGSKHSKLRNEKRLTQICKKN